MTDDKWCGLCGEKTIAGEILVNISVIGVCAHCLSMCDEYDGEGNGMKINDFTYEEKQNALDEAFVIMNADKAERAEKESEAERRD